MQDIVEGGEEAVKEANERYLPLLSDQDTEEYGKYKMRADFFNATGRTTSALMGFLFRKDPDIKLPANPGPQVSAFVADATLTGKAFYDLCADVAKGVLVYGRCGTIIDWNEEENQPYATHYNASDIINWKYTRIRGRMTLSLLVLKEQSDVYVNTGDGTKAPDGYAQVNYEQWREWKLVSDGQGGEFVACIVWRRRKGSAKRTNQAGLPGTGPSESAGTSKAEDFVAINSYFPRRGAKALTDIPFVFHSPVGPHGDSVERPPLMDMANVNLSMYRTSADLENALHFLGVPTPYLAGFKDTASADVVLGSTQCLVTSEPNAKAGFLELSGTGLKALDDAVVRKERHMAALGARMLDQQHSLGRSPEAYATVALRQTGETAVLTSISLALSLSMTDVLAWAYWWCQRSLATPEDAEKLVGYTLTTDFLGTKMDAATLQSLFQVFIGGGMSFEVFFTNLQQGELIPAGRDMEEEKAAIKDGQSMLMALAGAGGGDRATRAGRHPARARYERRSGR